MSNDMSMMTDMAISSAMQPSIDTFHNGAMSLRQTKDPVQKEKELRDASESFEAIFLQKMWEEMHASLPENSMHGSKEEKYWQSMYAQQLGVEMAKNGGIGLADMMMEQLTRDTVKSPSAANIFNRAPMSVSPAPLMPENALPVNEVDKAIRDGKMTIEEARSYTPEQENTQSTQSTNHAQTQHATAMHTMGDNLYEEMEQGDHINPASTMLTEQVTQANHSVSGALTHTIEPMVTTTRKETNSAGRTTTRTVTIPLSEYQANLNKNASNDVKQDTTQNIVSNPLVESFATQHNLAPNYTQASEAAIVQNAMANKIENKPSSPPQSDLMRQTLDELQNQVAHNPTLTTDPIVIHTSYRTNLPSSQRSQALLTKDGSLSKEHQQALNTQIAQQQEAIKAEQDRLATLHAMSDENGELSEYPEELMNNASMQNMHTQAHNQTQNHNDQNQDVQDTASTLNPYDTDPLAGIQARYISPLQVRMEEAKKAFEQKLAEEQNSLLDSTTPIQSIADVQAQIDTLMTRENRANYTFATTNATMQATLNQNNTSQNNSMAHMLANSTYINDTSNLIATNTLSRETTNTILPVFRSMPSLDVALKSGNLIASLTPEQIRLSQMGGNQNQIETATTPDSQNAESMRMANTKETPQYAHAGGPKYLQPDEAFLINTNNNMSYVSGISPKMNMQAPVQGEINSAFGWRLDPITKERAWHTGIDIAANAGDIVQVAAKGRVIFAGDYEDLGNTIIVEHENGLHSVYGHNAELLVAEGEEISSGTNIAKVGVSGRTSGAHLHFEVRHNGLAINPEPYLLQNNA